MSAETAVGAERAELGLVGRRAEDRGRIELPIAGVQHVAERRADNKRVGNRDRMGDGDELDIERAEVEVAELDIGDRNSGAPDSPGRLAASSAAVKGVA